MPETSAPILPLWLALLGSYALGSVPFGLLAVRWRLGQDLRKIGSGNIGATNAMRALGKPWGIAVFFADFLKGFLPTLFLAPLAAEGEGLMLARVLCGVVAVLGHCFPVWLGFKGGKGVATACGAIVAIDPLVFLIAGAVWLVTLKLTSYVGLASVLMGLAFPVAAWVRHPRGWPFLSGMIGLAVLIVVRHRGNLLRILRGVEPRAGQRHSTGMNAPTQRHG